MGPAISMDQPAVQPRQGVLVHGGDLADAASLFPQAPGPWIDLSTGINPWPYPVPDLPGASWTRLPGKAAEAALLRAAADAYGVPDPALLAAAPGSQILIQTLPFLRLPGTVAILSPTYGEHAPAWERAGHQVSLIHTLPDPDKGPLPDVLVLVNPNNPDGRLIVPDILLRWQERLAARGGWLVVDEAFADLVPESSLAPYAGREGLVILRSFGKFFGLAGLRLGFLAAPVSLVQALTGRLGPWAVPGPALELGAMALADRPWQDRMRGQLAQARAGLDAILAGGGREIVGGTDLYRLIRLEDAPDLFTRLGQAAIWVRRFPDRPDWLRLGLPPDVAAMERLAGVLRL